MVAVAGISCCEDGVVFCLEALERDGASLECAPLDASSATTIFFCLEYLALEEVALECALLETPFSATTFFGLEVLAREGIVLEWALVEDWFNLALVLVFNCGMCNILYPFWMNNRVWLRVA